MFRLKFNIFSNTGTAGGGGTDTGGGTGTGGTDTGGGTGTGGTGTGSTTDKSALPIIVIDARDNSDDIDLFLDMINNPCDYRGKVVYLTHLGPTVRPDPFLWADKFYFNEGCEWFESPFALGALL